MTKCCGRPLRRVSRPGARYIVRVCFVCRARYITHPGGGTTRVK